MKHTNDSSRNALAFIGLASEYCSAIESASQSDKEEFTALMLRLLPRIYITISDISPAADIEDYDPVQPYLDADAYEQIRTSIATLYGEEDTYLETFSQDMQYSVEALPATISESLADIYQPLLDCAIAVRDSEGALTENAVAWVRDSFADYWGQTLTNVLRALHNIYYK